ncbi:GrpB family protein [Leptobacterium flavescens]|uniref:GrpB family protein n=1 Tax=Leptobacterium flavescens TaxID=472055 RepID=A0A6P0UX84_9FLAO|nr:GrpB family protein [Leptobacterium flavescens]NER15066.1 GrpB family protein [Leptobacterium flavescens]
MKRTLKDLTREEWNKLFPIKLVEHNPDWTGIYEKEKTRIISNVEKEIILRIEHFGSSSIPGIRSKPYIDIMIEIPKELLFSKSVIKPFEDLGYSYFKVPERENIDAYMSFGKGYNLEGKKEQIYHIHMCPKENVMWDQIYFRDYLKSNRERARQYEELKLQLASEFQNDRGAYVLGKTDFIKETIDLINEIKS